jgi:hypothetical protein
MVEFMKRQINKVVHMLVIVPMSLSCFFIFIDAPNCIKFIFIKNELFAPIKNKTNHLTKKKIIIFILTFV